MNKRGSRINIAFSCIVVFAVATYLGQQVRERQREMVCECELERDRENKERQRQRESDRDRFFSWKFRRHKKKLDNCSLIKKKSKKE